MKSVIAIGKACPAMSKMLRAFMLPARGNSANSCAVYNSALAKLSLAIRITATANVYCSRHLRLHLPHAKFSLALTLT